MNDLKANLDLTPQATQISVFEESRKKENQNNLNNSNENDSESEIDDDDDDDDDQLDTNNCYGRFLNTLKTTTTKIWNKV